MKQVTYDHIVKNLQSLEIDLEKGKVLNRRACSSQRGGYLYCMVDYKNLYIHQIIAVAGGLNPVGNTVNHIDGNKLNNSFSNLEVMSLSDNVKESYRQGLQETSRQTKLTDSQVIEIKTLLSKGNHLQKEIAEIYGVSKSTISQIKTGTSRGGI